MTVLKHNFANFLKGIVIGIGAIIPGMSGGTAAVICNVFEDILEASANFFKHIKSSIVFMLPILFGALLSVYAFSPFINLFCEHFPFMSKLSFCLISLICTFLFAKNSLDKNVSSMKTICLTLGIISAIIISILTSKSQILLSDSNLLMYFFIGFPLALALVLPAISFSYMLLFFGIYEKVIEAILCLDLYILFPLGGGVLFGVYLFSKLLHNLIRHHAQETYSFVLGFVLCSAIDILI